MRIKFIAVFLGLIIGAPVIAEEEKFPMSEFLSGIFKDVVEEDDIKKIFHKDGTDTKTGGIVRPNQLEAGNLIP